MPHQQFNYDGKGRLTWIKQNGEETHYRLDPAGNREMLPSSANPNQWYEEISLREVRHNRLVQDKDFHYVYDNFGNRIQTLPAPYNNESLSTAQPVNSGNRHEYRYDAQQRLVAFWDNYYGRDKRTEYLYDAFGRRVAKINPRKDTPQDADVIFYGWDGDKLVTTQYNQEKIYTLYAPNSFVPLLRLTQPLNADTNTFPNTIHTYYCDHRGAPTALISKEGKIEWQAEYDVWGARLNYSKPDTLYQPIRLQGQHYDVESGLYYNRHRFYDPKIGRYISQDPIGLKGGSNLYAYPMNPNQFVDPMGLAPMASIYPKKVANEAIFDGIGDTKACSYYDSMIKIAPSCSYYEEAAKICRGNNPMVNILTNYNIYFSSDRKNKLKQSEIYTKIRNSLAKSDAKAQAEGQIDKNGCTFGDVIDEYHDQAFLEAGLNPTFYGGNLSFQGIWPNPVPVDPSSWRY